MILAGHGRSCFTPWLHHGWGQRGVPGIPVS